MGNRANIKAEPAKLICQIARGMIRFLVSGRDLAAPQEPNGTLAEARDQSGLDRSSAALFISGNHSEPVGSGSAHSPAWGTSGGSEPPQIPSSEGFCSDSRNKKLALHRASWSHCILIY
jgi:hypothetical protein